MTGWNGAITGKNVKVWWYDPREFTPPSRGPVNDRVLVLDDAEKAEPAERGR